MYFKRCLRNVLLRVLGWIANTAMDEPDYYIHVANFNEYAKEIGPWVFELARSQYWSCGCFGIGDRLVVSISTDLGQPMNVNLLGWQFTMPDQKTEQNTQGDWMILDAYTGKAL